MIVDINSIYSFHHLGQRDNQEDSRYPDADMPSLDTAIFAVCDGVGGCDKGEVASSAVCSRIGEVTASHVNTDQFTDNDFRRVLNLAYLALDEVSDESNKGMGTTLTFVAFHSGGVLAAHIGDSRIYQIRPGEGIIYRSEDHSLVNALLRSGNISPDQVKGHPKSNVVTRCMSANDGTRDRDDATAVNLGDIVPGDFFLLCTDGVTGNVDDEELIEIYSSDMTDEDKYNKLAERCRDSSDNNTAIQIHVGLVTVDPEQDVEEDAETSDGNDRVPTQQLPQMEGSVHELSASREKTQSKIKSFFKRLFK